SAGDARAGWSASSPDHPRICFTQRPHLLRPSRRSQRTYASPRPPEKGWCQRGVPLRAAALIARRATLWSAAREPGGYRRRIRPSAPSAALERDADGSDVAGGQRAREGVDSDEGDPPLTADYVSADGEIRRDRPVL